MQKRLSSDLTERGGRKRNEHSARGKRAQRKKSNPSVKKKKGTANGKREGVIERGKGFSKGKRRPRTKGALW